MTMTVMMTMKPLEDLEILEGLNEPLDESPDETPAEPSTDLELSRLLTMTLMTRLLIKPVSALANHPQTSGSKQFTAPLLRL